MLEHPILTPIAEGGSPFVDPPQRDAAPKIPKEPSPTEPPSQPPPTDAGGTPPDPADTASQEDVRKAISENADPRSPTPNPPIDEATRKQFAQHGIFQDQNGDFYKHSEVMKNPDGRPMTAEEVRATLPDAAPQGSASQSTAPKGP